ncbi:SDR family NAD(P)-dependent oxidoreductase [Actinomadura atramentaria]|uniref:SDR family NAD(P)-dependent oxidoreductase n=1 Tax=Actinomadura atramentaria TaxID=1990 RepID=UPI00037B229C|nr:SDR family NAD(P)-dependent oxidoreductase [Actinomadura atramentaria]
MTRRTALITGASRGLGLALARLLARDGWQLVIDARDGDALAAGAAGLGDRVEAVAGDVADPRHRAGLARAVAAAGGLDLLVHNASTLGTVPLPPLADQPVDELADAFAVNVLAPLALTQAVLPALRACGGSVLAITSDAATEAYPGWGGYGMTKAALEQLSAVLAVEEPSLRVWWADPGEMNTAMLRAAGEDADSAPPPEHAAAALLRLVSERPPSGRHRVSDLAASQ